MTDAQREVHDKMLATMRAKRTSPFEPTSVVTIAQNADVALTVRAGAIQLAEQYRLLMGEALSMVSEADEAFLHWRERMVTQLDQHTVTGVTPAPTSETRAIRVRDPQ